MSATLSAIGEIMQYTVTQQFERGEENPIAEFTDSNDAHVFLSKKLAQADLEKLRLIYRIYDDSELVGEINPDQISTAYSQYAEGNSDLTSLAFDFAVMIKAEGSEVKKQLASFKDKSDASLFIISKCAADDGIKDNDLFFIYKGDSLIDTSNKIITSARKRVSERSKFGEKGATFKPSPLQTRPKPPGSPGDFWVEEEDEDNS